jgi:hypothetical protein
LYAASPLFNGGGVSTNANLKALMGYPTYDANRWQKALDAANELIGLNYYALQTSFSGVFTTKKNTEIILAKQSGNNFLIENYNAPVGFGSPAASLGLTSPSQNLVDAFPTITGLDITNAQSGYDPQNPYANRDPRLALTVFLMVKLGCVEPLKLLKEDWISQEVLPFKLAQDITYVSLWQIFRTIPPIPIRAITSHYSDTRKYS